MPWLPGDPAAVSLRGPHAVIYRVKGIVVVDEGAEVVLAVPRLPELGLGEVSFSKATGEEVQFSFIRVAVGALAAGTGWPKETPSLEVAPVDMRRLIKQYYVAEDEATSAEAEMQSASSRTGGPTAAPQRAGAASSSAAPVPAAVTAALGALGARGRRGRRALGLAR